MYSRLVDLEKVYNKESWRELDIKVYVLFYAVNALLLTENLNNLQ